MPTKSEVFAAYAGDVDAILAAWPNVDPEGYAAWEASALRRLLRADVRAWQRRQVVQVDADVQPEPSGQDRLVDVPARTRRRARMRAKVATDDGSVDFLSLSGAQGAATLRRAAMRDRPGALTTVERCNRLLAIADAIEAESEAMGREVTVAEVLEQVA